MNMKHLSVFALVVGLGVLSASAKEVRVGDWDQLRSSYAEDTGDDVTFVLDGDVTDGSAEPQKLVVLRRSLCIDLNGHCLGGAQFNVQSNTLSFKDSSPGGPGLVDGRGRTLFDDNGGKTSARVCAEGVTFTNCVSSVENRGGVGTLRNTLEGEFRNCRFVGCSGVNGGVFYCYGQYNRLILENCRFEHNGVAAGVTCSQGGAIYNHFGKTIATACTFSGNRSESGSVLYAYSGEVNLMACVATNNVSSSGCLYVRSTRCVGTNCVFAANANASGARQPFVTFMEATDSYSYHGYATLVSSIIDVEPTDDQVYWCNGGRNVSYNGVTIVSTYLDFNDNGEIKGGYAYFDPRAEPYASYVRLQSGAKVLIDETESGNCWYYYVNRSYNMKPCYYTVDGVKFTYDVNGGAVVLGGYDYDQRRCAVVSMPPGTTSISVPGTVGDYNVCFGEAAFRSDALKDVKTYRFLGPPPNRDFGEVWLNDNPIGYYPPQYAAEWWSYLDSNRFRGIEMSVYPYVRSWADIVDHWTHSESNSRPRSIILENDIVQDGQVLVSGEEHDRWYLFDLNGFRLTAGTNGFLSLDYPCCIELSDSSTERTGRICIAAADPSSVRRAVVTLNHEGGYLTSQGVTFEDCRRSIRGSVCDVNWGSGIFRNCRIVGCSGNSTLYVGKGSLSATACRFEGNETSGAGCGTVVNADGKVELSSCSFANNRSTSACVLSSPEGGDSSSRSIVLRDCEARSNSCTQSGGACLALAGSACTCTQENGLFTGNTGSDGSPLPVAKLDAATYVCKGGVVDVAPTDPSGMTVTNWVASGSEATAHDGRLVVAREGTAKFGPDGVICAGTFAFNPTNAPYASVLRLHSDAKVVERQDGNAKWYGLELNGGPYSAIIDGVDFTFTVQDGKAKIGDGVNPAVKMVQEMLVVTVPEAIWGYPVVGICSNAFVACGNVSMIRFPGRPLAEMSDGAFSENMLGCYPSAYADEWENACTRKVDEKTGEYLDWHGLTMAEEPFASTWSDVEKILRRTGSTRLVVLKDNIVQEGPAVWVTNDVAIALNGFRLTVAADGLATVGENGKLTIRDGSTDRTGRIVSTASGLPESAVVTVCHESGSVDCEGVTFENCRCASGGCVGDISFGRAFFQDCAFIGCTGGCDSVLHVLRGELSLASCRFESNVLSGEGSAPLVNRQGKTDVSTSCFAGNRAGAGGVLSSADGTDRVALCEARRNVCTLPGAGCLHLSGSAGSCRQVNGVFVDNTGVGGAPLPVASLEQPVYRCAGGVVDVAPTNRLQAADVRWVEDGSAAYAHNGHLVVARDGSVAYNAAGEICAGTFAFDPKSDPYASVLRLNPSAQVVETPGVGDMSYVVSTVGEGPFLGMFGGVEFTFVIRDGKAVIGDGVNAAVASVPQGTVAIMIPETLGGYPVVGINTNAFTACPGGVSVLEFTGRPPTDVADGAFGPTVSGVYPLAHESEWLAAGHPDGVTNLVWKGIAMGESPFVRKWTDMELLVRKGGDNLVLYLMSDIVQDGPTLPIATNTVYVLLNGHRLSANTNGLAAVSGRALLLVMDTAGRGGTIDCAGCHSTDAARGVFSVGTNATLECLNVTFSACRHVEEGGVGVICGRGSFRSCLFQECSAAGGGVFSVVGNGQLTVGDCLFTKNRADRGCLVKASGGLVRLIECEAYENEVAELPGGCVSLSGTARYEQENGVFAWNVLTNGPIPVAVLDSAAGTPTCLCKGGIVDAAPTGKDGRPVADWVAVGSSAEPYDDFIVVARAGTLAFDGNDLIRAGTFAFDPSADPYAQFLKLHSGAKIGDRQRDAYGDCYVLTVTGGPFTSDDGTYAYVVRDGKAYLGNGTDPAIKDVTATRIVIPCDIDGFVVAGLEANAFGTCTQAKEIAFQGDPVGTVGANALPPGAAVSYLWTHEQAWQTVLIDGTWHGCEVLSPRFSVWQDVKAALESGYSVTLGADVTGSNETIRLTGAACAPTLDLNGCSVTLPQTDAEFLLVTDGAGLTLADAVGTGGITAGLGAETFGPCIRIGPKSSFRMTGGSIHGFDGAGSSSLVQVESNAVFTLSGGTLEENADFGGGIVSIGGEAVMLGGTIARNERSVAVAVRGEGRFDLNGGEIAENRSEADGFAIVSAAGESQVRLWNGVIRGNASKKAPFCGTGNGRISFYGALVRGNTTAGRPSSVTADGTGCRVYGGVFDVRPARTAVGYEVRTVGDWQVVAVEGTLGTGDGVLTAGRFTFDPLAGEIGALRLADPVRSSVTALHGTPTLYSLSVDYAVPCHRWEDLQANIQAGNAILFDADFNPEIDHKMPSGFVYRASALDESGKGAVGELTVGLRLYERAKGGTPVWTGTTNVTIEARSEGVFQIWVSEAMADSARAKTLEEVFKSGTGVYLGVTLGGGEECTPRRTLVTTPLANRTSVSAAFDPNASVDYLEAGTVSCKSLELAGGVCATFEIAATNTAYNISEMNVGGCTLYRHEDNRILSQKDGEWTVRTVRTGDVLAERVMKSGLLTIQSTDDMSVPLLAVPVPEGGSFIWQSDDFAGRYRFTCFGEND